MKSTDRNTRKATPRKIKASPRGKIRDADQGWLKRAMAIHRRHQHEDNRLFAVFAGAILRVSSLSMDTKIELLKFGAEAISEDRTRRGLEQGLQKAERAHLKKPSNKTSLAERLTLGGETLLGLISLTWRRLNATWGVVLPKTSSIRFGSAAYP
jgi:hypothetical protein